jgi:phage gpG-like protein
VKYEIIVEGEKKLNQSLKKLETEYPRIQEQILRSWAEEVLKVSKDEYLTAAEADKTRLHVRTGRLRKSINYWLQGDSAFVGSNLVYAPIHEFGFAFIPARPYLKPSIERLFKTDKARRLAELQIRRWLKRLEK